MPVDFDTLVLGPLNAVFGEPVAYRPVVGAAFPVSGVFDEAYHELQVLDGVANTTTMPVLGVRLAEFPSDPARGDMLTVRGVDYVVREARPDGHGHAKLMLNAAP